MKAFSVLGTTKSGKTTTIENIVKDITRRGYSVGTIKEIHYENFAIDAPGTNTYRHRQAGAELVCARGYQETDIMYGHKLPIEEIIQFYTQDYLIMEGVADYNVPLIICAGGKEELQSHVKEPYFNRVFAIAGKVSNQGMDSFNQIPVINAESSTEQLTDLVIEKVFDLLPDFSPQCCNQCGYDCRTLGARILKGLSRRSECRLQDADIVLSIGGTQVEMVPFVKDILRGSIDGIIKNLRGYKPGKKIEITINR